MAFNLKPLLSVALLASCLVCCAPQARAQSIYGPGGLFLNPTADFPEKGQITVAALGMPQKVDTDGNRLTWSSYSVDYGLSEKWEIGATYLKINPGSSQFKDGSAGFYAKYKVMDEVRGKRPALAVGGNFLTGGDADARSAFAALRYTVTSPEAKNPLRLHLGAIYIDEMDGIKHRDLTPYIGADFGLTRSLSAFAELRPRLDGASSGVSGSYAARSLGLVWNPSNRYKLVLAYGSNGWNDQPSQLGIGVGYGLGGGRTR